MFGAALGETAANIFLLFTEMLPAAFSSALGAVREFFATIGDFFVGIARWFTDLFGSIADAIQGFLQPVVDFFAGIGRAIKNVFDSIVDTVIRILRKLPEAVLPSSLEKLAHSPLSSEVQGPDAFAAIAPQNAAPAAAAANSPTPAAADAQSRAGAISQLQANLRSFAGEQDRRRGQAPPLQIHVQVDGETVARAVHNADQANASRAFSPVPAY